MSLLSKNTNQSFYSIHLYNEKFIECDPLTFNLIIPLSGNYYYIGNQIEEYDLENYDTVKPFDILLSTSMNPDFLFTLNDNTLLLVLSIKKSFFYEHFKNRMVGYHIVLDDKARAELNVLVGNLCSMEIDNVPTDFKVVLNHIVELFNSIIIRTNINTETENNISIAEQFYTELQDPDTQQKNLKDIFEDFDYSRSYVSSKFKKITNINLVDYLRLRRVSSTFNNIQKSSQEMTYLAGFRNEKIMKESLRLITGYSFKKLRQMMKDSPMDMEFIDSPSFQLYLDYTSTLLNDQSIVSTGEKEERNTHHVVEKYESIQKFKPVWKNLADFRQFRFEENIAFSKNKLKYFNDLEYDNYRLKLLYRNDGKFFIDLGNESFFTLKQSTLVNILRHFAKDSGFIISVDFVTLNYDSFDDLIKKNGEEVLLDVFDERKFFDFFSIIDFKTMKNISLEFSLGNILHSSDVEKSTYDAAILLKKLIQNLQKSVYKNHLNWGVQVSEVNLQNVIYLDKVLEGLRAQYLLPSFLSLSVDEKDSESGNSNVDHLLYTYERIIEDLSKCTNTIRENWNIKVYITRFYLYFNLSLLDRKLWNSFFNTVVLEGFSQTLKAIDGVGCITIVSDGEKYDVSLFNRHGFVNMLYYTMLLSNDIKGDIIYNDNGSIVFKDGDIFYMLIYSVTETSYFYMQKYNMLNYSWKNSVVLKDLPGSYSITHKSLDYYHGDFNSTLANFYNPEFLSKESWNYIERATMPKLETLQITTKDDLCIETEMVPFSIHFYKIERF
ncbi:MAG: hypothetical protein Q4Q07_01760 [Tissierellia bacterium]|nr:hypothetical protein [Tissierellia bacterium]